MRSKSSASTELLTAGALRRLLDAGRALVSELDFEAVLERVLETAAEVTGARYAALGILGEGRDGLERFLTRGLDQPLHGEPPRGRALLGTLICDPRPLRVEAVSDDPRAKGFPPGHARMGTFLGVPIVVRGEAWGNLYLCDKGEPFTAGDEAAVLELADWAAVAIANARVYDRNERRVRRLRATSEIVHALGRETDLARTLELIADRGQRLIGASGLLILLREPAGLVVTTCAGEAPPGVRGTCVSGTGEALALAGGDGVLVPLVFRGQPLGVLIALGIRSDGDEEKLLRAFAASAATAVATTRTVEEKRLRDVVHAAEEERCRWARELHDVTLQGLGGLRLLVNAAARSDAPGPVLAEALDRTDEEIDALRSLIRELRPAALDELGMTAAIEGLAERVAARGQIEVTAAVRLAVARHAPELETAVYRIVQEAVGNAVRHAGAGQIEIGVCEAGSHVEISVHDDGGGFDPAAEHTGCGLGGMRERVALLHGDLEVASSPLGTTVTAALPV